jgi:hypothetical protein
MTSVSTYYVSHRYRNKSMSQLTIHMPAQLAAVALSSGHIVCTIVAWRVISKQNLLRPWRSRAAVPMLTNVLPSACLRGLARHFKTEPTETVALCFGYPKTPSRRAKGKLSTVVDEQHKSLHVTYVLFIY